MTLKTVQQLLIIAYLAAPILAVALAIFDRRHRDGAADRTGDRPARRRHIGGVAFTFSASIVLGCAISLAYAVAVGGHIALSQIALTVYLVAALMFILRFFDAILCGVLKQIWIRGLSPLAPPEHPRTRVLLAVIPGLARAAVLLFVGLPYLLGAALVYRPRIVPQNDPSAMQLRFEPATIETSDGLALSAWFMPGEDANFRQGQYQTSSEIEPTPAPPKSKSKSAAERARRLNKRAQAPAPNPDLAPDDFSTDSTPAPTTTTTTRTDRTIILCHGFSSSKAGVMRLARPLVRAGYNVLAIDFRAHGESEGQILSLGADEKRDVLAAVRWLQDNHPRQARTIYGFGVSSGAAALLAAAADPSDEGQSIAAVAVYESYDSAAKLAREFSRDRFIPPFSWVADRVGLAVASLHAGTDLVHFAPANAARELWPRPILVVHGGIDMVVPFDRGEAVYDAAQEPKRRLWLSLDDYAAALKSREAIANVIEFFNEARSVPSA